MNSPNPRPRLLPALRSCAALAGGAALLALVACSRGEARLVGSWLQVQGERPGTRLILRQDGTGRLEVQGSINYQVDDWGLESERHLRFRIFDQDVLARFVVGKESLELSRVEGFEEVNGTYRREPAN